MCQVNTCSVSYASKSLLTQHFKLKHDLVRKKVKLDGPSFVKVDLIIKTIIIYAHVLSDAPAIQRQNDQKVGTRTCKRPKENGIESFF